MNRTSFRDDEMGRRGLEGSVGKQDSETWPWEPTCPQATDPAVASDGLAPGTPLPPPGGGGSFAGKMQGLEEGVGLPPRLWSFVLDASDQAGSKLIRSIVGAFKTLPSPSSP